MTLEEQKEIRQFYAQKLAKLFIQHILPLVKEKGMGKLTPQHLADLLLLMNGRKKVGKR